MKRNYITCVSFLLLFFASGTYAAGRTMYISPNNDGVQDSLIIPLRITDKRYVTSWSLVITDKDGKIVRTIGNKIELPQKMTVSSFLKRLVTPKKGVAIPETVTWNGALDNGETAPDGDYYYYVTAADDNGNTGYTPDIRKTAPLHVVVDNTPPAIVLDQPDQNDRIFGEGAKSEFQIKQSGSQEDLWTAQFCNARNETVKSIKWESSAPLSFRWNGTNDSGTPVADGIYSYIITAKDRAGNVSVPASITGIIYSAEKPATNITINSGKYFSPGTSSSLQTITFGVTIPVPAKDSGNRLVDWQINVIDRNGKVYTSFHSKNTAETGNPPATIVFNGKDNNGNILPDGEYQAFMTASYLNGYEPAPIKSPVFVLDTTKPEAVVRASDRIFSPDGDGIKDTVTLYEMITPENGAPVKSWQGFIVSAEDASKTVRQFDFGEFPPESVVWDGIDSNGKLAGDGSYNYVLTATDLAGNICRKTTDESFTLDTSKTEVVLAARGMAFSPNNDRVKDTIGFSVISKTRSAVSDYSLEIDDAKGNAVKTVKGTRALPESFIWDGKGNDGLVCSDGAYTALLVVSSESGSQAKSVTRPFELDTQPPALTAAVPWTTFSPDGDGNQDNLPVTITGCTDEQLWTGKITDAKGMTVRSYTWKGTIQTADETGKMSSGFIWNGTDEAGNKVSDGTYTLVLASEDEAGNRFSTKVSNITLDTRETKAYVTTALDGISPNGDNFKDTQKFTIRTTLKEGISSWHFNICGADGTTVRSWSDADSADLPAEITWDGFDAAGKIAEGTFTGTLTMTYIKGNKVTAVSSPFVCSVIPPLLTVATAPEYFSPDNDGTDDDLFIKLSGKTQNKLTKWAFTIMDPQNGHTFWQTAGTSTITERIIWDGLSNTSKDTSGMAERVQSAMDYPWVFTATDDLGMSSTVQGKISVDVLVIRDGNVLKMAVPSIIFRSDHADFKTEAEVGKGGLSADKAANDERVLKRIAEILTKFSDYKVTIVGHANRATAYEEEETQDNPKIWGPALIPLSQDRAKFVKDYLVNHGISADRLSTEGKGATELVVDWQDKDNNWKNRRVEFILNK